MKSHRLALHERKTGARHVPLGKAARYLIDHLAESYPGEWRFPGTAPDGHMSEAMLYRFWYNLRDEVGIVADARLCDLSHSHTSHAIMNGESLYTAGKLLDHRRNATSKRYAHLDNATLSEAAERWAAAIEQQLRA